MIEMKKRALNLLLITAILMFPILNSCKENFSPVSYLEDRYVLFSALSVFPDAGFNTYSVSVNISRIFYLDGYNSSSQQVESFVKWAVVNLSVNNKNYVLTQRRIIDKSDSLNIDTQYVYSAVGVVIKGNDKIAISAKLPNGKILSSQTQVPVEFEVKLSYPFTEGFSSQIDRFLWGNSLTFSWKTLSYGHLYFPKLEIVYYDAINKKYCFKEVASKYISRNGSTEPYYPAYQLTKSVSFDYDAVDSAMTVIAKSDPERKNEIYYLIGSVLEFDEPLSNYYSGLHGKVDRFSIRLDEGLYTNITGGIGVFGIGCISKTSKIKFREDYLQKFGYSFIEGN